MKYTFLNVANFKNGLSIPIFKVFDPASKRVYYKAFVYGRDNRGAITAVSTFEHDSHSKVKAWRESRANDQR